MSLLPYKKPMKINIFILFIFICYSQTINAQLKPSINIGKATTNSITKNKPAQFIGTFPKEDSTKNSWLVDGYLSIGLKNESKAFSFGLCGEIHKNNLLTKKIDYREISLTADKDFFVFCQKPGFEGDTIKSLHTRIITSSTLEYAHNNIYDTHNFIGIIGFSVSLERGKKWRFLQPNTLLINHRKNIGKYINFSHEHSFDMGYIVGDNNVLLGDINFECNIFPFSGIMDKHKQPEFFYINYGIVARTKLAGSTSSDLENLNTLSAGIKYHINNKSSLGFAYYRYNGADPFEGVDNQAYETISLKLRVVL